MAQQLTGTIERVTFHNPDTGYAVLRVAARGRRGVVTVVGKLPAVTAGARMMQEKHWASDVLGGYLGGFAVAAACVAAYEAASAR